MTDNPLGFTVQASELGDSWLPSDHLKDHLKARRAAIQKFPIEEDDVFEMGSTPGAKAGWECAACQGSSGLAYASLPDARRGFELHQAKEHS